MKNLASILFLLTAFGSVAQTLSNLDTKYGILKFKLESPFEIHKSNLKADDVYKSDEKLRSYTYTGIDIKEVLGYDVQTITLLYWNNKLYEVQIKYKESQLQFKSSILNKLELLFGKGQYFSDVTQEQFHTEWSYNWQAKKAFCRFEKVKWSTDNDYCMKLWIKSLKMEKEIAESEF